MTATGDCFTAAMHVMMESPDDDRLFLVHGTVWHQDVGRHSHAWVERRVDAPVPDNLPDEYRLIWERMDHDLVIDKANGNDVEMSRTAYYALGHAEAGSIYTYTEMAALAVEHGHYGPWDESTQ